MEMNLQEFITDMENTIKEEFGFGEVVTEHYLSKGELFINIKTYDGLENLRNYLNARLNLSDNMDIIAREFLKADKKMRY